MPDTTMPLRERAARAYYAVDPYVDHTGAVRPWEELWPDQLESVYSRVDPVIAAIATQPRPEMAEIEAAIRLLVSTAQTEGIEYQKLDNGYRAPEVRQEMNYRHARTTAGACEGLYALISSALAVPAVPAGMVLVPVAEIRELDDTLSIYADRFADLEDDNDYYRSGADFDGHDAINLRDAAHLIRALLPEDGE